MKVRQADRSNFHFTSPHPIVSVIGPKRRQLTEHLQHPGPSTIRGLSRSLDRDVKTMMDWGLVESNEDGLVHVLYSAIHAAFDLRGLA